jgi:primosomal protein N' (replication factor Y)
MAPEFTYGEVVFSLPIEGSFTYCWDSSLGAQVGCRVEAQFGRRKLQGLIILAHPHKPESDFEIKPILRLIDQQPLFGPFTLPLAKKVAAYTLSSLGEVLFSMIPGGKREKALPLLGESTELGAEKAKVLSQEQRAAIDGISAGGPGSLHYLEGITGSGKTEVFLQLAEQTLGRGQGVIYLVPEISLTHQIKRTLAQRFPQGVAILHSSLTPSQRLEQWRKIQRGEINLVVGARSAIFAPLSKPGLIVIDEEHEGAYKASNAPRYHARQVAQFLGGISGAKVLMGSATPSLEASFFMDQGRIPRYKLTQRLSGGAMPEMELVDMKKETGILSSRLAEELMQTVEEGRQAIFFLNRRGYTYFFRCHSCHYELYCPQCSVPLTYHKSKGKLLCHYCGYQEDPKQVCPDCGSTDVGFVGFGTEHIEEELAGRFPHIRFARLDADVTAKKNKLTEILGAFERGEVDVLLGTQMVAKGLNFPRLKLVGIILADTGLNLPDFRAQERTFGLIQQVAGRAGRFHPDGKVIIQTFRPKNPAIRFALKDDRQGFIQQELALREIQGFPPYSRLLRFVFRGKDPHKVEKASHQAAQALPEGYQGIEILGPSPCPLEVLAGNHRHQILLKGQDMAALLHLGAFVKQEAKGFTGVYLEIDVDPQALL